MHDQKRHATLGNNPIQFLLPNINRVLLQHDKQAEVLDQGIWKFNVTGVIRSGNPKWKNGVHAIRLRLEWIRVESRGIIKDVEILIPFEVVVHESRPKTPYIPFF